jgi:hypothetical protein
MVAGLKVTIPQIQFNLLTIVDAFLDDFAFNYIENKTLQERISLISKDDIYLLVSKYGENKFGKYLTKDISERNFIKFTELFKDSIKYVYPLNGDVDSPEIVIVMKYDKNMKQNFINGAYSKMYAKESNPMRTMLILKGMRCKNPYWQITTQDADYAATFIANIKKRFGTKLSKSEAVDGREFDIPPIIKEEVLNCDIYSVSKDFEFDVKETNDLLIMS